MHRSCNVALRERAGARCINYEVEVEDNYCDYTAPIRLRCRVLAYDPWDLLPHSLWICHAWRTDTGEEVALSELEGQEQLFRSAPVPPPPQHLEAPVPPPPQHPEAHVPPLAYYRMINSLQIY